MVGSKPLITRGRLRWKINAIRSIIAIVIITITINIA